MRALLQVPGDEASGAPALDSSPLLVNITAKRYII